MTVAGFFLSLFFPLFFGGLFLFSWKTEKRRLINGLFINLFILNLLGYLIFLTLTLQSIPLIILSGIILFPLAFILLFGVYGLIFFLFSNARTVLQKESGRLSNFLGFLLAIFLTVWLALNRLFSDTPQPRFAQRILLCISLLLLYYTIALFNFLSVSLLYGKIKPPFHQDYIIVLGAGLLRGNEVSPLLAGRIDRAIAFLQKQEAATGKSAFLLLSGGQGANETISEAAAMKAYALAKGIPPARILLEEQSKTTYQNMCCSKKLIEEHSKGNTFHALFVTSEYHLFRAAVLARLAKLQADGIGSKTARYFLPNAFLREFVAIIAMRRRRHLAANLLMILCVVLLSIFVS